jgi:hypothetical protein
MMSLKNGEVKEQVISSDVMKEMLRPGCADFPHAKGVNGGFLTGNDFLLTDVFE